MWIESKFTRIYGLTCTASTLSILHDYGETEMAWDDILCVFAGKVRDAQGGETPILLLAARDHPGLFLIEGLKISPSHFIFIDSKTEDRFERSYLTGRSPDLTEKKFRWVASEICSQLKRAYIDRPVLESIKGSTFFLPHFNSLKDSILYCNQVLNQTDPQEVKGTKALSADDYGETRVHTPSTTREEWKPGMVIDGKYTIQEIIRGGMGIVYIAFEPAGARFFAVKTYQEKYLWNERVVRQFVKEAEIWINLEKHPHIVKAELVRIIEGKPYIFLEYIPGIDLHELLKEDFLSVKKSIEMAIQFCDGMSYAFKKLGLIHRDIKPSNCIITKDGVLKITDFGLGKIFDEAAAEGELVMIPQKQRKRHVRASSSTAMVGTLPFMAPELFKNVKASGVKTDIYAFGVVLYIMLTGINPFYDEDQNELISKHLNTEPSPPHALNSDVPPELSEITLKCLMKDPGHRFNTFEEIKLELEQIYRTTYGAPYKLPEAEVIFTEEDWINKGKSLAMINRHREAIVTFEQALKIDPESADARIQKARSLLRIGETGEALSLFDEVLKASPASWEAWFYRGEAERLAGRTDEALSSFERALELEPSKAEIMGSMGSLLEEMGRIDNALFCFDFALERNPKIEDLWVGKGKILLKQFRFEDASKCFDQAIEINPRHQSAWFHRGETLYRLCHYAEAIEAYRTALTLNPESIRERLRIGNCYLELGDRERAMRTYDQALKINKSDSELYLAKASLLEYMNLHDEALNNLSEAALIDQGNKKISLQMARIYFNIGEYEKVLTACSCFTDADEEAWEIDLLRESASNWIVHMKHILSACAVRAPLDRKDIYRDLSSLLSVFCDVEDAYTHLQIEIELGENGHKLYLAAILSKIMGHTEESVKLCGKSIEFDADNAEARSFLTELTAESEHLKTQDKPKRGILAGILRKDAGAGRNPEDLMIAGLEALWRKEYDQALGPLQKSLENKPDHNPSRFFLAMAQRGLGEITQAGVNLDHFASQFPSSPGLLKYRLHHELQAAERAAKEELLQQWIALMPGDPEPWLSFIIFLTDGRDTAEARLVAKEICRSLINNWSIPKRSARFWHLRGILELFSGSTGKPIRFFEKSLTYDPQDPVAHLGLAKCYDLRGNESMAHKILDTLSVDENCQIMKLFQSSCFHLRNKRQREALIDIEKALVKKPDSPVLNYKKAQIYIESGDYEGFWNFYYSIYHLDARYPTFFLLRTRAFVDSARVNEAFSYIRGALDADPDNLLLLDILAFLYLKTHACEKAIECFDRILSSDSLHIRCYLGKGIACYMMGRFQTALTFFQKYLISYPNDPDIYFYIGATHFHLKDHKNALLYLRKPVEMKSRFARAWSNLGIYYCRRGKHTHSMRYADWALRIDRENFLAWICRSRAQQEQGNLEDAYNSIETALLYSPHDLCGWIQRGIVEFRLKDYRKSLESFSKACEIDEHQPTVWYNRGAAALCSREYKEAHQYLDRSLAAAPSLFLAWVAKAVLGKIQNDQSLYVEAKSRALSINLNEFQKWYEEFSLLKERSFHDSILLYEEIPLEFDLPPYPALESIEPVQIIHYYRLDRNF